MWKSILNSEYSHFDKSETEPSLTLYSLLQVGSELAATVFTSSFELIST